MTELASLDGVSCLVPQQPAPRSPTLRALEGRNFTQVYPEYIRLTGSLPGAILLGHLVYWFLPTAEGKSRLKGMFDGKRWLSRSYRELEADLGLSKHNLLKAREALNLTGLITVRDGSYNARRTLCWHLHLGRLNALLMDLIAQEGPASGLPEDADQLMQKELTEFSEVTVGPIVGASTHAPQDVHPPTAAPPSTLGEASSKPITKNLYSPEEIHKNPGVATAPQQPVEGGVGMFEVGDGFMDGKLTAPESKSAKLAKVRAQYGRKTPRSGIVKPLKTPNLPWMGIHAAPGPGSGGLRVKKVESAMTLKQGPKPPTKPSFRDKMKEPAKSLKELLAEPKVNSSSHAAHAKAKSGPLTASQLEFIWKKELGNRFGFQKPFTGKERGQASQLCKKLPRFELVDLLTFLLDGQLTPSGGTRWGDFAARVKDAKGTSTIPSQPHLGFLLAHFDIGMQMLQKANAAPLPKSVGYTLPTGPAEPGIVTYHGVKIHAGNAVTPPPVSQPVSKPTIHDDAHKMKVSLGIGMLNGMKPPSDLTPEQVDEYKALAKAALASDED